MVKTETDPGFGKFFFSEILKWYSGLINNRINEESDVCGG